VPCETASSTRQGDRDTNQDRCAIRFRDTAVLLLLADGMGGHPRGELAAQVYVDSLSRSFLEAPWPVAAPARFLEAAFATAHAAIVSAGGREQPPVSPLTTGVACLVQDRQACWAHAGDSRLYLIREGGTVARTHDHSLVQEDIDLGVWPEQERGHHPLRNLVTRSLGGPDRTATAELADPVTLENGDTLLLCSDGVWSVLPETRLAGLASADDLTTAVDDLTREAEQAAHPLSDNVTLVACRMR